jgi:CheY-like chemotaxis protein
MMPGLNGLDFCKMVKSDERVAHTPVILLTARSEDEQRLEGFEAGADDYITKAIQLSGARIKDQKPYFVDVKFCTPFLRRRMESRQVKPEITSLDQQFIRDMVQVIEKRISECRIYSYRSGP